MNIIFNINITKKPHKLTTIEVTPIPPNTSIFEIVTLQSVHLAC